MLLGACLGTDRYYVGSVLVDPDEAGSVAGVSSDDLTLVTEDVGGFVYGFAQDVDAVIVGRSAGAGTGDSGAFLVAGVLPEPDVGAPFVSGSASYNGDYEMLVVTGHESSANPDTWTEETFAGSITATVRLEEEITPFTNPDRRIFLDAVSADERVVYEDIEFQLPGSGTFDTTEIRVFDGGGRVILDGNEVSVLSEIAFGEDGLVGAFAGEGTNVFVAGGMVLGNN